MRYSEEVLNLFNSKKVQDRFWSKVSKGAVDECWEWRGGNSGKSYGCFSLNRRTYLSHILSLWSHLNEEPKGRYTCHSCDNPCCVNPNHLWYGTAKENTQDSKNKNRLNRKGRISNLKGERHGRCIITEPQAIEILRIRKETGESRACLHKIFPEVACHIIDGLIYNQSWKHLPR